MNPVDFIIKNITEMLLAKGYQEHIAKRCAIHSANEYQKMGNQNGKMFQVLLNQAEIRAKRLKGAETRNKKKQKAR